MWTGHLASGFFQRDHGNGTHSRGSAEGWGDGKGRRHLLSQLQDASHFCCLLTVSFFNADMNFALFYKTERAPDYYDARKLLENWVSSFLFSFSFSCISSKYQMMRTAGAECKLMGQPRNEYPKISIFNRIKLSSGGRGKCWHFAKICSHFHQDLEFWWQF